MSKKTEIKLKPEKELANFIVRNVVPGAGDTLKKLRTLKDVNAMLIDELEAYIDGRAYDKESGLVWEHRLEHTKYLIVRCGALAGN